MATRCVACLLCLLMLILLREPAQA